MKISTKLVVSIGVLGLFGGAGKVFADIYDDSPLLESEVIISEVEAIKIFQDKLPKVSIEKIELQKDGQYPTWEIEGSDKKNEYDLKIDASSKTKKIVKQTKERLDKDEQILDKTNTLSLKNNITMKEAVIIALKEVTNGTVTSCELKQELNIPVWKVQIEEQGLEKEFTINAQTSELLTIDIED